MEMGLQNNAHVRLFVRLSVASAVPSTQSCSLSSWFTLPCMHQFTSSQSPTSLSPSITPSIFLLPFYKSFHSSIVFLCLDCLHERRREAADYTSLRWYLSGRLISWCV